MLRLPRRAHGVARLVVDLDQLDRVLGERSRAGEHDRDRLAGVPNLAVGEHGVCLLGAHLAAHGRHHGKPGELGQLSRGQHGDHPVDRLRNVDRGDRRRRIRGADERRVHEAVTIEIVEIAGFAAEHAGVLSSPQRRADRSGGVDRGCAGVAHRSRARIQSATSGRYSYGMLLHTCVPSS